MNQRALDFLAAAAILGVARVALSLAKRRSHDPRGAPQEGAPCRSLFQLVLASFLTLFAELAFIRWISVEIRVFAYFKNLALLLCFLGFGLGCSLVNEKTRWLQAIKSFLGLVLVVRIPLQHGRVLEGLSQSLGAASDVEIWETGNAWDWLHFVHGALLAGALFVLIVSVFVPLGQCVSRQMNLSRRPLEAYSWNLVGSLSGVGTFWAASRWMLPPTLWLSSILVGFALLQTTRKKQLFIVGLMVPLALLLHDPARPNTSILWTPYQEIENTRYYTLERELGIAVISVNHTSYQTIVNLSPEFLARHPGLTKEAAEENPYNLPFRFASTSPKVLIVGSGAGNDVAAALRHQSRSVDAVEIDPAIVELGRGEHPEHPYQSSTVSVHVDDARAFFKRTRERYDLILFATLDSHTQFSDYSNMRIDNFVYTEESFREAKRLLSPSGVMFIKFQVNHPWMATRLSEMLSETFGKSPLVFFANSNYPGGSTCFVVSSSTQVEEALSRDTGLQELVRRTTVRPAGNPVPITTDDWPYLYQQGRWIPRTYFSLAILLILVALGFYSQIKEARRQPPSLFFFSMGAGFLLVETQVISRLALFFGTTWKVNGIVISALLFALLLANLIVDKGPTLSRFWLWAGVLVGLLLAYVFPLNRIPTSAAIAGTIATIVFAVPVVLAGILFALEFRRVESPSAALGANMLGAVAGGLLENCSLLLGMRSLLLITIGLYCLAGVGLRLLRTRSRALEAVAASTASAVTTSPAGL